MNIGRELKNIRKKHNLSQKDLAALLEVHQRRISHWEKNSRKISAENFLHILRVLNEKIPIEEKSNAATN